MSYRMVLLIANFALIFLLAQGDSVKQVSSKSSSSLPAHPAKRNVPENLPEPKGAITNIGNLSVYETESKSNASIALIAVYDLFGFHPHVKYIADKIAEGNNGIQVIIPDFFHGKPYDADNFPPPNFQNEVDDLFQPDGYWKRTVKADLKNVIQHYQSQHIDRFGIFGFCWGGKMSVYAAADPQFSSTIKAAGLVHPSKVVTADADNAQCPMILLPSKDEPDMIPFFNKLESSFKGQSKHKRFPDMRHGFAGGRSDFSDTVVKGRVDEVIQLLRSYFRNEL